MTAAEIAISRAFQRGRGLAQSLADIEPGLVVPFLIAGLAAPRVLPAALAAAALFWGIRWIAWGRPTAPSAANPAIAGLVLMLPVSLWVTALPEVTREQALWLLAGIALFYVIVNWVRTAERERSVVLGLVGLSLFAALISPLAATWVTDIKLTIIPEALYRRIPLLAPIPIHPNVLAGILVLGLPVPLALLMFSKARMRPWERAVAAAAAALISIVLILTKSRGALLAAALAALALCLLRWRRAWVVIAAAALLAGLALWGVGFAAVAERLTATGTTVGWPGRFEIWSRALYLIQDFPFTGIGMGTFERVTNELYPYFLLGPNADVPHAHNLFLQVAVDLGIPGLLAWLGVLMVTLRSAWRVYQTGRREGLSWATGLGAGLVGSQLALLTHGMLDAAVWGAHSGLVVWALWGMCIAAGRLRSGPPDQRAPA